MSATPAERNRRILIIDDNRTIHEDYRKLLIPQPIQPALRQARAASFRNSAEAPPPDAIDDFLRRINRPLSESVSFCGRTG